MIGLRSPIGPPDGVEADVGGVPVQPGPERRGAVEGAAAPAKHGETSPGRRPRVQERAEYPVGVDVQLATVRLDGCSEIVGHYRNAHLDHQSPLWVARSKAPGRLTSGWSPTSQVDERDRFLAGLSFV